MTSGRDKYLAAGTCRNCGGVRVDGRTSCAVCLEKNRVRCAGRGPTYRIWSNMLSRCRNPKATNYADYGGRGIAVCDRWLSFENFLFDMGEVPAGMTLDRADNEKGYGPDNCRWVSMTEQCNNRRSNLRVDFNGTTRTLAEWSRATGIPYGALQNRVTTHDWPIERALTTPLRKQGAA